MTKGTKEWADTNVNFVAGCSHDCLYCYAKKMAIRFNRKTSETWKVMDLNYKNLVKNYRKRKGRIMFPTSHDITNDAGVEYYCLVLLKKVLKAGNSVLITTKPRLNVIQNICEAFEKYKDQIQFRFTITSIDDRILQYWEPNAPLFIERF